LFIQSRDGFGFIVIGAFVFTESLASGFSPGNGDGDGQTQNCQPFRRIRRTQFLGEV